MNTNTNKDGFTAWVTNLGKYNEGEIIDKAVNFPLADEDEIKNILKEIGIGAEYEEYFVADYDAEFDTTDLGEYTPLSRLQEIGERYSELSDEERTVFNEISSETSTLDEAFDIVEDGNYIIYSDCDSMKDVAYQYVDNAGLLENIPTSVSNYFDYEKYGREMDIRGWYIDSKAFNGYISILN